MWLTVRAFLPHCVVALPGNAVDLPGSGERGAHHELPYPGGEGRGPRGDGGARRLLRVEHSVVWEGKVLRLDEFEKFELPPRSGRQRLERMTLPRSCASKKGLPGCEDLRARNCSNLCTNSVVVGCGRSAGYLFVFVVLIGLSIGTVLDLVRRDRGRSDGSRSRAEPMRVAVPSRPMPRAWDDVRGASCAASDDILSWAGSYGHERKIYEKSRTSTNQFFDFRPAVAQIS